MPIESYYDQIDQAIGSIPSYTLFLLLCGGSLIGGFFLASFLFKFRGTTRRVVAYPASGLAGTALAALVYLGSAPGFASKTQEVRLLTRHLCLDYVDSARYGHIAAPPGPEEISANAYARNISMLCYRAGVSEASLRSAFASLVQDNVITSDPPWEPSQSRMVQGPRRL